MSDLNENNRLANLLKNFDFRKIYSKILNKEDLNNKEEEYILTCILILFSNFDNDKRLKKTFNFAYHLLILYTQLTKSYRPLFDISIELGLYPISVHILNKQLIDKDDFSINDIISGHFIREFYEKLEKDEVIEKKYILTKEQFVNSENIIRDKSDNISYIAPTSFGKSSIIKDFISNNNYKKICIVVPSKSLIQQNLYDFNNYHNDFKLISHENMYSNQSKILCILTQERAIRLLNKIDCFDMIFIDEAHNLLDYSKNNLRGIALSKFIGLSKSKNPKTRYLYLSPLIKKSENVLIEGQNFIKEYSINNNIKTEKIYYFRDNTLSIYDKYTNGYFNEKRIELSFEKYIISNSSEKNFIYNFKPKNIEKIAEKISQHLEVVNSKELLKIKKTLINEVHEDFNLVEYIDKGLIYLHAKIPNIIKEYLEHKYKEFIDFKFLIANSVILEGINLPIKTLFITSSTELNYNSLINLIGRVNRLNYVFKENNLDSLLSNIHFVEDKSYNKSSTLKAGIERLKNIIKDDVIKNPLLENYNIDLLKFQNTKDGKSKEQKKKEREIFDNEVKNNFIIQLNQNEEDRLLRYLINNNFEEIYKIEELNDISKIIKKRFLENKNKFEDIITFIYVYLINDLNTFIVDEALRRLNHKPTRDYYEFYLNTIRKQSNKDAIISTYKYFLQKADSEDPLLYFGESFGETIRPVENIDPKKLKNVYVNLSLYKTNKKKLINLAIVKLKIEEDFVSYNLSKMVNLLYDFKIISDEMYNEFSYGTNEKKYLQYIYIGLSISTIKKLIDDNQIDNLNYDSTTFIVANDKFKEYFKLQTELFKFELSKYIQL